MKIFTPIVDHLKLQVRLNLKTRNVEIKVGTSIHSSMCSNVHICSNACSVMYLLQTALWLNVIGLTIPYMKMVKLHELDENDSAIFFFIETRIEKKKCAQFHT